MVVVGAVASALTLAPAHAQTAAVFPHAQAPTVVCGTSRLEPTSSLRAARATEIPSGTPLSFDQDPPLVAPDYDGVISLRNIEIAGDVPAIRFRRPLAGGGEALSTWPRAGSRSVDGRLISVFELTWSGADLAEALSLWTWGFDNPGLFWGSIEIPEAGISRPVFVRMALGGIPASRVVRLNSRVQYASNVVNLVVPGFGDRRLAAGPQGFEFEDVARLFYAFFADEYDVLAIVPASSPLGDYGGFHRIVQNRVGGLNLAFADESTTYGSTSVLQGLELYAGVTGATYEHTNHETAHQWGSSFDWTRIAGIARAGHEPAVHAPLWTGGETLLGAVLSGDRRVHAAAGGYEIERTPAPARFHPLELYAMGALPASQVPDFGVFVDQQQFEALPVMPAAGTRLRGDLRRISILDVVREHGVRSGPSPAVWRRATVLVTRDRLATGREMDVWNFFAQRLDGGARPDAPTVAGFVPFRAATNGAVRLSTVVRPRTSQGLPEVIDVAATPFGARDWRGVIFSAPVPRRYRAGTSITLSGRVPRGSIDAERVEIAAWRDGVEPIVFAGAVSPAGDFDVTLRFSDDQRGPYTASLFLQGARARSLIGSLATVTVE